MASLLSPFRRSETTLSGDNDFYSLWHDMDRLFADLTRGLGQFAASDSFLSPAVDVAETDTGLDVKAELPGIDRKDIDIELKDDVLTIRAEKKFEREERDEKKRRHLSERSYGTFLRRFRLPFEADDSKVEATFENGLLHVFIPRTERAQSQIRKIEVKPTAH